MAARNLSVLYRDLSTSTRRLSSGLRIQSAADDAAGLAVREVMRTEIAVLNQGVRNASDAISLVRTADDALAIIDEKLTRMKELAEQAATGTYTTAQRVLMNSEYQAMADEIDRIAAETDFNDQMLLDGSLKYLNRSNGLKVHFGPGNSAAEDYYYIRVDDMRATTASGLRVGGDGKNDIWGQGILTRCCGNAGYDSLTTPIAGVSGRAFAYAYNYDQNAAMDPDGGGGGSLEATVSYLAGMYRANGDWSLQDLINAVNAGTQSRVKVDFVTNVCASTWNLGAGAVNVILGNEVYQYYSGAAVSGYDATRDVFKLLPLNQLAGTALARAINQSSKSFWAVVRNGDVFVFHKTGGNYDYVTAQEQGLGASGIAAAAARLQWQNMETYQTAASSTVFAMGGEDWGRFTAAQTVGGGWGVRLEGRDVGDRNDLRLADVGSGATYDLNLGGLSFGTIRTISGFTTSDFSQLQDAADPIWNGAEIRTQSAAQAALAAITDAISRKDGARADLGAVHNRLENTVTALTLQASTLSEAESRISDVDVALEVTAFTRAQILVQAATAMVAQANTLHGLALALLRTN
jgi:flagellin